MAHYDLVIYTVVTLEAVIPRGEGERAVLTEVEQSDPIHNSKKIAFRARVLNELVRELAVERRVRAIDVTGEPWIDMDNTLAFRHAIV